METIALLGITLWLILFWGLIGCCYFWFNCLLTWENDGMDEEDVPKQLALFEQVRKQREYNFFTGRPSEDSILLPNAKDTSKKVASKSYGTNVKFRDETSSLLFDVDETAVQQNSPKINFL